MTTRVELNTSIRPPSGRISSATRRRVELKSAQAVNHEPCSSTLGKFHDSVNYTLNGESLATKKQSHYPKNHPIIEAKQKFKYMTNPKSYVDESLFGDSTHRRNSLTTNNTHLTHNFMSNMTPLIHNTSMRGESASARTPRIIQQTLDLNESPNKIVESKNLVRPWKP